jgi:diguanylate cyclase (GGDEF)-like protein
MSSDFYWESDTEHRLTQRGSADRKLSSVSVFRTGAQIGARRWEIPSLSPDEAGWRAHRAVLDAHLPFREFELSRMGIDGTEKHILISGNPIFAADGGFRGYRGVGSDISARKLTEERIRQLAHHDSLTGLPNRLLFNDRLDQAISLAKRDSRQFALLYLDLDKFKPVNDSLGHAAGDQLLKEVAARIRRLLRESDTLARVGGDEFIVILPDIAGREVAETVVRKIVSALAAPFLLGDPKHSIEIGASIGIAVYPADALSADALVKAADIAMYAGKEGLVAAA